MTTGETDDVLIAAVAEDLMGVFCAIPAEESTLERIRAAAIGYFERPDHIAVDVTSGLVEAPADERWSRPLGMTFRPNTAYGRVLLERRRRLMVGAD